MARELRVQADSCIPCFISHEQAGGDAGLNLKKHVGFLYC